MSQLARQPLLPDSAVLSPKTDTKGTPVASVVRRGVQSGGAELDAATRSSLEPRFGRDFGHVRVHTDTAAAESAAALNASAFTVGRDIVFGSGRYAPQTGEGRQLLVHELTHVVH